MDVRLQDEWISFYSVVLVGHIKQWESFNVDVCTFPSRICLGYLCRTCSTTCQTVGDAKPELV